MSALEKDPEHDKVELQSDGIDKHQDPIAYDVLLKRQYRLTGVYDDAFLDAFQMLAERGGEDAEQFEHTHNNQMRLYTRWRKTLLHQKLVKGIDDANDDIPANRFGFVKNLELNRVMHMKDVGKKDVHDLHKRYRVWRGELLRRRYLKLAEQLDTHKLNRLAANALNRAMTAEREEREKFYQQIEAESSSSDSDEETAPRFQRKKTAPRTTVPIAMTEWQTLTQLATPSSSDGHRQRVTALAFALHDTLSDVSTSQSNNTSDLLQSNDEGMRIFAYGTKEGSVAVCDAMTGTTLAAAAANMADCQVLHTGEVTDLAWSMGNVYLASGGEDKSIRLWNIQLPKGWDSNDTRMPPTSILSCARTFQTIMPVTHVAFLPTSANIIIYASSLPSARNVGSDNSADGANKLVKRSPLAKIKRLGTSKQSASLAALNVSTGRTVQELSIPAAISAMKFIHTGSLLFLADVTARVYCHAVSFDSSLQLNRPLNEIRRIVHAKPNSTSRTQSGNNDFKRSHRSVANFSSKITQLTFRPYDSGFRAPLLVCVDTKGTAFGLKLPADVASQSTSLSRTSSKASHPKQAISRTLKQTTRIDAEMVNLFRPRCLPRNTRFQFCVPCLQSDCFASATGGRDIQILDPHAKTVSLAYVATLGGHKGVVTHCVWNANETCLVSADQAGLLWSWVQVRAIENSNGSQRVVGDSTPTEANVSPYNADVPHVSRQDYIICPNCQKPIQDTCMLTHIEECVRR